MKKTQSNAFYTSERYKWSFSLLCIVFRMFPSHRALSFIKFMIYFFPTKYSIRPAGVSFLMFKIYVCFGGFNQMCCVSYNNLTFLTGKKGLDYASLLIFCRHNQTNTNEKYHMLFIALCSYAADFKTFAPRKCIKKFLQTSKFLYDE